MWSRGKNGLVVAFALTSVATTGLVAADDGKPGSVPISSGVSFAGDSFSVEAVAVTAGDLAVGGVFRLLGASWAKADPSLYSDGFESGDTSNWSATVPEIEFPSDAVVAFDLEECPAGWVESSELRGRALVGLVLEGQLGGGVGSQWTGENDSHYHYPNFTVTTDSRGHNHHWSTLVNASFETWQTLSSSNSILNMVSWTDGGMGKGGEGHYPLAAAPGAWLFTENSYHSHSLTVDNVILDWDAEPLPNVQLRYCRKE